MRKFAQGHCESRQVVQVKQRRALICN